MGPLLTGFELRLFLRLLRLEYLPTNAELSEDIGLGSPQQVSYLLRQLHNKGFLTYLRTPQSRRRSVVLPGARVLGPRAPEIDRIVQRVHRLARMPGTTQRSVAAALGVSGATAYRNWPDDLRRAARASGQTGS